MRVSPSLLLRRPWTHCADYTAFGVSRDQRRVVKNSSVGWSETMGALQSRDPGAQWRRLRRSSAAAPSSKRPGWEIGDGDL
jgi:hypothetical protein